MRNLETRLDRLEATALGVIVMWQHHTETDDQAMTRWKASHPSEDPERPGLRVMLVRWADPQDAVVPPLQKQ